VFQRLFFQHWKRYWHRSDTLTTRVLWNGMGSLRYLLLIPAIGAGGCDVNWQSIQQKKLDGSAGFKSSPFAGQSLFFSLILKCFWHMFMSVPLFLWAFLKQPVWNSHKNRQQTTFRSNNVLLETAMFFWKQQCSFWNIQKPFETSFESLKTTFKTSFSVEEAKWYIKLPERPFVC